MSSFLVSLLVICSCTVSISGRVEADGVGVEGVNIWVDQAEGSISYPIFLPYGEPSITDSDGNYTLELPLDPSIMILVPRLNYKVELIVRPHNEDYFFEPAGRKVDMNFSLINGGKVDGVDFHAINLCEGETCWYGNYNINSQEDIDALSGYTGLKGVLYIEDTNLENLNGLEDLKFATALYIENNSQLLNLNGLNNLKVYETLSIIDNIALTSLEGLNGTTKVQGNVYINNNDSLVNLAGLDNLTMLTSYWEAFFFGYRQVGGSLSISYNDSLTNLESLSNLCSLDDYLLIADNIQLCDYLATEIIGQVVFCDGFGGSITISGNKTCP